MRADKDEGLMDANWRRTRRMKRLHRCRLVPADQMWDVTQSKHFQVSVLCLSSPFMCSRGTQTSVFVSPLCLKVIKSCQFHFSGVIIEDLGGFSFTVQSVAVVIRMMKYFHSYKTISTQVSVLSLKYNIQVLLPPRAKSKQADLRRAAWSKSVGCCCCC